MEAITKLKSRLKKFTSNYVTQKNNNINQIKKEQGITLVALVITIIILIILATVTINVVFGEEGLIKKAQQAKNMTEEETKQEEEELNTLMQEYANVMKEDTLIPEPEPEPDKPYVDGSIVVEPQISEGMIPVKYDKSSEKWIKTTVKDSSWYNYGEKKWANVVLGDAIFTKSGEQEILDESKTYSMLVWIPRYAYKITSQYHQNGGTAGGIDIVFIDTANKGKDGKVTYKITYPSATTNGAMSDYVVHPAFNYGGTGLLGFWVGKFETSSVEGNSNSSSGDNVANKTAQIKAGVASWRYIQVSNIFTVCTEMNKSGNPYKLNTSDDVVDPHMMKNSEWGAVAYLSQNAKYGKGSEVWVNNSSSFITGSAGNSASAREDEGTTNDYKSTQGQNASTTGNVTGVYDMSGCSYEYVAGYINNSYVQSGKNQYTSGKSLIDAVNAGKTKYADVYKVTTDSQQNNYNNAQPTTGQGTPTKDTGHYGDAVWETSNKHLNTNSWYSDISEFPYTSFPFFHRGGLYSGNTSRGVFYFNYYLGDYYGYYSFRVVVPVL